MLMGAGAARVPGGNATPLLNALPALVLLAIGASPAMLGGIAAVSRLMRRAHLSMLPLRCTAAGCTEVHSPSSPQEEGDSRWTTCMAIHRH